MLGTNSYKTGITLTFPEAGVDLVRVLCAEHLAAVEAVMDDPDAARYFTRSELVDIGFQRLMLAQMIARMDRSRRDA